MNDEQVMIKLFELQGRPISETIKEWHEADPVVHMLLGFDSQNVKKKITADIV